MTIETILHQRSGSKCELCGAAENLHSYEDFLLQTKS